MSEATPFVRDAALIPMNGYKPRNLRWRGSRDLYVRVERGALANLLARGEAVILYPASAGSHQTGERP